MIKCIIKYSPLGRVIRMPGLLYPAYQKLYSAVQNLKRFSKENSFFDNISSLDSFFSEYRSTTLVLQESLAHTPYLDLYKKLSDGIWDPFFNAQRVKTIHQHPSEYKKSVDITVYLPNKKASVISKEYTIENDVPLNILIDSLKSFFSESRMFTDNLLSFYGGKKTDNASFRVSIENKLKNKEICFVTPNFSNQRIMMQQGLFMFPYTLDKETHKSIITSKTSLIKIPKELRQESISYLDTLGYNAFRLMPDLSSICAKIKESIRNEFIYDG